VTPTVYQFFADMVLYLHAGFVLFVVLSLFLIIAGGALGWRWVHIRSFRVCHLLAIGVVVMQAWMGVICPLTRLEMNLRIQGGEAIYPGSFIAHWVEGLLYYDLPGWVFVMMYTLFGLAVVASWLGVPPRPRRRD
jgi:hypothetical protein